MIRAALAFSFIAYVTACSPDPATPAAATASSPAPLDGAAQFLLNQSSCSCRKLPATATSKAKADKAGDVCMLFGPDGETLVDTPTVDGSCDMNTCRTMLKGRDGADQVCAPIAGIKRQESGWQGPYEINSHNCHHAANGAVVCDQTGKTAVVMCEVNAKDGPNQIHAVNITEHDCAAPRPGLPRVNGCRTYCIWEPQFGDNDAACCWQQYGGKGANIADGQGAYCAAEMCVDQYDETQKVVPAAPVGASWCAENRKTPEDCAACCDDNTWVKVIPGLKETTLSDAKSSGAKNWIYAGKANQFRGECAKACEAFKP